VLLSAEADVAADRPLRNGVAAGRFVSWPALALLLTLLTLLPALVTPSARAGP